MLALARSAGVWITRMRLIFIDKVGGARGTLFTGGTIFTPTPFVTKTIRRGNRTLPRHVGFQARENEFSG